MNKLNLPVPVVVSYARTPVGDFMGSLSSLSGVELGTIAAAAALERADVKGEDVGEVVCGMVYRAGTKGNPARQIAMKLNCLPSSTASTIDQQCASGMRAFELACWSVMLGQSDIALAVGAESMSNVPHLLLNSRKGYRLGDASIKDALLYDALQCAMMGYHMGITAENLVEQYNITREEQDELAVLSHQRASAAIAEGRFKNEIVPVEIKTRKGVTVVDTDEHPKAGTNLESLARLKPAFKKDGTVTGGNASGINDGAVAAVIMTEDKAKELGLKPICRVTSIASYGVPPEVMGIGPAYAVPKALDLAGLTADDMSYYEINEAFAAQFLAVNRELKIDMADVNVNGSGIALGHPVGCTGLRIIIALIEELKRRGKPYGCASLCVGGGPSMATIVEML